MDIDYKTLQLQDRSPELMQVIADAKQTTDTFKRDDAILTLRKFTKDASRTLKNFWSIDNEVKEEIYVDALINCLRNYNPEKAGFFHYYSMVVRNLAASYLQKETSPKYRPLKNTPVCSLSQMICSPKDGTIYDSEIGYRAIANPKANKVFSEVTDAIDAESVKKVAKKRLSKLEYNVLLLDCEGYSHSEMADKLGTSAKAVDNALSRVKFKSSDIAKITDKTLPRFSTAKRRKKTQEVE